MLVSRNVTVSGRRTSIRLEPEMWDGLTEICGREEITPHQLVTLVDRCRHRSSLTAKLRVFIFAYFRTACTEAGHAEVGHGPAPSPNARLRGAQGRRARKMPPLIGNDSLYQAVYSELEQLDSRRSHPSSRAD